MLDNCHVRVSFATNDERTAKRVSDALGTATEMRAMKNYAGHRLSPWLGHLMVSRQESARPLLTPGEVMQLPADDELVLVSGFPPIRARKARYFEDPRLAERILAPSTTDQPSGRSPPPDDWTQLPLPPVNPSGKGACSADSETDDRSNGGIRREPELPPHEEIVHRVAAQPVPEFLFGEDNQPDAFACPRSRASSEAVWRVRPRWIPVMAAGLSPAMRTKHTFRLPPDLALQLAGYADRKRVPQALVVETALASYLSPDHSERMEAALGRRLDRLTRQVERLERHITISNEALALFVRFWLTVTPPLPDTAQPAAQAKGRERYLSFVEALGRRLARGQSLAQEISQDVTATDDASNR